MNLSRNTWICLALLFILFHYCAYLAVFFDPSVSWDDLHPSLVFLNFLSLAGLITAFLQFSKWQVITLTICVIGFCFTEPFITFEVWFRGVNSVESLITKWDIFSQYPLALCMGLRNGIFVPILYLATTILVLQEWKGSNYEQIDI